VALYFRYSVVGKYEVVMYTYHEGEGTRGQNIT
jgi:hypothetical protein